MWEAVLDDDGQMIRVRWSEADAQGRRLYVRHYPADGWGRNAAEGEAKRFNADGRRPEEWATYRPVSVLSAPPGNASGP